MKVCLMETKGMHSLYTYCLSVFFDVGSVGVMKKKRYGSSSLGTK